MNPSEPSICWAHELVDILPFMTIDTMAPIGGQPGCRISVSNASHLQSDLTLLDILSNDLVLRQIAPYVSLSSLLALASLNRASKSLIMEFSSSVAFRHISFTSISKHQYRKGPLSDLGVAELRRYPANPFLIDGIDMLRKSNVLCDVRTLIMDGLYVPFHVLQSIFSPHPARLGVRTLSIIGAKVDHPRLVDLIHSVCRLSRPESLPIVQAIYVSGKLTRELLEPIKPEFSYPTRPGGTMDIFYASPGTQPVPKSHGPLDITDVRPPGLWTDAIAACRGLIAFDLLKCRSPQHEIGLCEARSTVLATHIFASGCVSCGTSPEGPLSSLSPTSDFPLLCPPPLHSSTVRAARMNFSHLPGGRLFVRCMHCMLNRCCIECGKWWCEDCLPTSIGQAETDSKPMEMKVNMGLCVESCLRDVLMSGGGEGGMWG